MASLSLLFTMFFPLVSAAPGDWSGLFARPGVQFGVEIGGPSPYAQNANVPFAPASNAKMLTALALLERVGGQYTYPTVVQWNARSDGAAENLRVLGYGDPSWGMSEFGDHTLTRIDALTEALQAQGVREIYGEIAVVAGDPRWDNLRYPQGWKPEDANDCEGALAQAFNLNLNCARFQITAANASRWLDAGVDEPIQLQIQPGRVTNLLVGLADPAHPANGFVFKGTLRRGARPTYVLPVLNSKSWVRNLLLASLLRHGIRLFPQAGLVGGPARTLSVQSPPLNLIVKAMMKNSINLLGDALFKTLAANFGASGDPDLIHNGEAVLRAYLLAIGVPDAFTLFDGAGLSRQSRITPHALLAFLNYAKGSREFRDLWDALPIAGFDGTLRNRMKGTAAAQRLHAKTGTLDGVYNLSGFVSSHEGFIPFVFLTGTSVAEAAVARAAEDRAGAALADSLPRAITPLFQELAPFPYIPEHAGRDDQ